MHDYPGGISRIKSIFYLKVKCCDIEKYPEVPGDGQPAVLLAIETKTKGEIGGNTMEESGTFTASSPSMSKDLHQSNISEICEVRVRVKCIRSQLNLLYQTI